MKAILAWIMSILTALLSIFGLGGAIVGGGSDDVAGLTNGEWLQMLVENFNLVNQPYAEEPCYEAIPATDAYFKYVQICYVWGIVTAEDDFATSDPLTRSFMATTAVRAGTLVIEGEFSLDNLTGIANAEEIAAAISNGIIALTNGKFQDAKVSLEEAIEALKDAVAAWQGKTFENADLNVTLKEDAVDLSSQGLGLFDDEIPTDETEPNAADVFEEVAFEGKFAPDMRASSITDAEGQVLNDGVEGDEDSATVKDYSFDDFKLSDLKNLDVKALLSKVDWKSLLKKINFSFDVKLGSQSVKVNVAVVDDGFRATLSGMMFDGINFSKSYELSNFALNANMDANLMLANIKNSYVRLNYDLTEKTVISGKYASSLTEIEPDEGEAPKDVMDRLKAGLMEMARGTGGTVNLFTAVIPIPNLPAMTVTITFSLTITVDGTITLEVASEELKGFEIVNGRARFLNETTVKSEKMNANANAEAKANVNVDLSLLGFCLVDVGVTAGIGVSAYINLVLEDESGKISTHTIDNLPAGLLIDTKIPTSFEGMTYTGEVTVYFILEIYYGRKSVILNLIPSEYRDFKILGKSGSIAGDAASHIYKATFSSDGSEDRV